MNCCRPKKSTTERFLSQQTSNQEIIPQNNSTSNVRRDILLRIPECRVHLMDDGQSVELAAGDFELQWISDGNVALATAVKVGVEHQWPLTKDEPVVKLDALHYLFSLQMNEGQPLSYGVACAERSGGLLGPLDAFLTKNCSFTAARTSSRKRIGDIDWKEFAPALDNYNSLLAKAIARGTGHIVRGIFKCTDAYTNMVQKIGETMLIPADEEKNTVVPNQTQNFGSSGANKHKSSLEKSLIHAKKLSKMTEKLSKTMLNVVEEASDSVEEVRLASLDALKKIVDATEAAEKQAIKATAGAVQTAVTHRCGERAGEMTELSFATLGNCATTVRNIFKIRKAINTCIGSSNNSNDKKKME